MNRILDMVAIAALAVLFAGYIFHMALIAFAQPERDRAGEPCR